MIRTIESAMLTVVLMAFAAIYFYKNKETKPREYIWVGTGEDPFKE